MNERRSMILDVGTRMVFHTVLALSLFLLLSGHNAPGGGFVGGLVAGAAFVLRDVAADFGQRTGRLARISPEVLLGIGLLVAVGTGIAALLAGGELLESSKARWDLPLLGHTEVSSSLAFDVGVYLIVLGVVLTIVHHLGEEPEG